MAFARSSSGAGAEDLADGAADCCCEAAAGACADSDAGTAFGGVAQEIMSAPAAIANANLDALALVIVFTPLNIPTPG